MVIDSIVNYYSTVNSNIHRGVHFLSQQATSQYEKAREAVRRFINASTSEEIIITRGATESINLPPVYQDYYLMQEMRLLFLP